MLRPPAHVQGYQVLDKMRYKKPKMWALADMKQVLLLTGHHMASYVERSDMEQAVKALVVEFEAAEVKAMSTAAEVEKRQPESPSPGAQQEVRARGSRNHEFVLRWGIEELCFETFQRPRR